MHMRFQDIETRRLARLRTLAVLDTEPEPIFDALVRTARAVCGVPIALISLVDAQRQWFKASSGLDGVCETSREVSFCSHAIASDDLMEVPDALADARSRHNVLMYLDAADGGRRTFMVNCSPVPGAGGQPARSPLPYR